MRRPLKPTHVHINTLSIQCSTHGEHRLVIGGLDEVADMAAMILRDTYRQSGRKVTLTEHKIALADAEAATRDRSIDLGDLPF